MDIRLHSASDTTSLDLALADHVGRHLDAALVARGEAWLVVSGGRTPQGLFAHLARQPRNWSRVSVTLADERCIPADDALSNTSLIREHLQQKTAAALRFVPLTENTHFPAQFDFVLLGMGDDGHTASIFPDSPQRDAALAIDAPDWLQVDGGNPVPQRITLSARRLLASRSLALHVTGERKWQLLAQVLARPQPALPVSQLLHAPHPDKALFWAP
ncbi:MAG: 6-phosphogluconolactonase [Candidatus Dactylopiibacterium carminicum]|nr:MAG: 6-phosphogluconolactonase [Candidatus Dactylopiibacterium carminicum]